MVQAHAAVIREVHGEFSFEKIALEDPRPDEILIKISSVGLCHTDLTVVEGLVPSPLPIVLGHEGAGTVVAVGSAVSRFAVGDQVAASFAACGHCANCLTGREAYCDLFMPLNFGGVREDGSTTMTDAAGQTVHGNFFGQSSFASHALVHERNAVRVPAGYDLDLTGPLGCGIQTGAGAVMNTLNVGAGATIVVSGAGAVGLSAIMAARVVGATTIIAIDVIPERLTTAEHLGATHTINGRDADVVEQVRALTGGVGADFAIDTTGNEHVILNAVQATRFGGDIGLIGVSKPTAQLPISVISGKNLFGLIEGDAVPQVFIPKLIELNAQGRFPFDELITRYPFAEIDRAIADTQSGAAVKAVLVM